MVNVLNSLLIIAGSVEAENITTENGKIKTAQIEDLFIGTGGNVTFGEGATISWAMVSDPPTIPSSAGDVGSLPTNWVGTTYINENGVYTGEIVANQITAGTLSSATINTKDSAGKWTGIYARANHVPESNTMDFGFFYKDYCLLASLGGIFAVPSGQTLVIGSTTSEYYSGDIEVGCDIEVSGDAKFTGDVDFSNANVTGLSSTIATWG